MVLVRRIALVTLTVSLSAWPRPSRFAFLTLANIAFLFVHSESAASLPWS